MQVFPRLTSLAIRVKVKAFDSTAAGKAERNLRGITSRLRVRVSRYAVAVLLLLFLPEAICQEDRIENPYKVEAAFLRNFAHYVTWPDHAFPEDDSAWCIGLLGRDPLGDVLKTTLEGRTEKGRPFEVFLARALHELPKCQIVFIAYRDAERRREILRKLKDDPVLTVGNAPDFLQEGGIILLEINDRVRMSVNLDRARDASLTVQTKMLEVAHSVLENGVPREVHQR